MTKLSRTARSAISGRSSLLLSIVLVMMMLMMIGGCDGKKAARPQDVAQRFILDLRFREQEDVLEAIWPPTRQLLEQAYQEMVESSAGELAVGLEDMVWATRVHSAFLIRRMDLEGELPASLAEGDQVVVKVEYRDGRQASLPMRWGQGRWYVDLPVEEALPLEMPWSGEGELGEMDKEDLERSDTVDEEMIDHE